MSLQLFYRPFSIKILATISPCLASEGAVLKNKSLSGKVDKAGEVADGEIITTPFDIATFCKIAVVTPEQSAPMIALTLSDVINLSAAVAAAAASTQVESALMPSIFILPDKNFPRFIYF